MSKTTHSRGCNLEHGEVFRAISAYQYSVESLLETVSTCDSAAKAHMSGNASVRATLTIVAVEPESLTKPLPTVEGECEAEPHRCLLCLLC